MFPSRHHALDGAPLFVSAKTSAAIPARCPLLRDALVQATLDPVVRSIEFIASARVRQAQVELNAIVLDRADGRYLLDVVPARPVRDIEREGLVLIALDELALPSIVMTAEDIKREPRSANSRLVWSYRMHPVGIGMRLRILQALADDGPMSLASLLSAVQGERDPSPAVMALVCSNLVELDLTSAPLGPSTIARYRA
jgi:hypothetical protein